MKHSVALVLGTLFTIFDFAVSKVLATDYAFQVGTQQSGTTVTHFDNNDYMVYTSVDFGPSETTKGLIINYAKGCCGGKLEVRLGAGIDGPLIAEMTPAETSGGHLFISAHVELMTDVVGVQDISFVAKDSYGVMNLGWFELSNFIDRSVVGTRIPSTEYSNQAGTKFDNQYKNLGWFDNGDYVKYANVNFGSANEINGIRIRYGKGHNGSHVEVRLGGPTGTLIANFNPAFTGGWHMYMDAFVGIDGVTGIHDVTFVGKGGSGAMNLLWFELADRSNLYPHIAATAYSTQKGVRSNTEVINHFHKGTYITFSNLNFGGSGDTKSIRLRYSKRNDGGKIEIRVDGLEGPLIATFSPVNTGGSDKFINVDVPIELVDGVHDVTFVGRDTNSIWDFESFELSKVLLFKLETDYQVNDVNGRDIQCTYSTVREAYIEQVYNRYYSNSGFSLDEKFFAHLGVNTSVGAENYVYNFICGAAQAAMEAVPLDDITYDEGSQFIELFYSGRGSWSEETETNLFPGTSETPANVLKQDAYKVKDYKTISEKAVFKMPPLPQFDPSVCESHAAQCCWPRDRQANDNNGNCKKPYDSNCVDKDVADNTDLCYNKLDKAPYANDIDADGFSTYDYEGPVHCHGFAWSTEDQEVSTRYKANALFFVSMYDHMYKRGYVGSIPGSPMCGCVEHMPVVTRSDCTQTNVKESYIFYENKNAPGFSPVIDVISLRYQACEGANNKNNNLSAFVQQLVNDGKLSTVEQDIFKKHVVGDNKCPSAIQELWEESGFETGHTIDDTKWTHVVSQKFEDQKPIYNEKLFKEMVEAQDVQIVRRVCPSCKPSHKDIYYRRLTPMPADFDLLETLMNNWISADNLLNVDFSLHSTYIDAYYGTNGWTFCNYDASPKIGFPRDCGPTERVNNQGNSYTRSIGEARHNAFMIPVDPDFVSQLGHRWLGTDYAFQVGTQQSGSTVTHFDHNDYMVYTSVDFGPSETTKGLIINYAKGCCGGKLEVRLGAGIDGPLIAEMTPTNTGGWEKFISAHVELMTAVVGVQDISFVAKGSNGVMNLGWFELSA